MNLKDYLLECLLSEKSIIEELLYIDNKVQHTSLTYERLISLLKNVNEYEFDNNLEYIAITDGEIDTVFKILISIVKVNTLFVDRTFLGINKYLVSRVNLFYGEEIVKLDTSDDYKKYINCDYFVVISGIDGFVGEVSKFFNKSVIV